MSHSSYDSDYESMISKRKSRSDSFEGSSSRGSSSGAEFSLKKGPWTADEDEILRDHVKKYGEGNWNTVQKRSGLRRCGKSCRLRWTNHLRPNLKKCPFSEEEEKLIIKLHAQLQNKWAQMATQLPGRTDNEIKNFWNTRAKRCQRAGIPLYPPELCGSPPMIKKHRQLPRQEAGNIIASPLAYSFRPNALPVSCIPYSSSITTFGRPFSQMSRYQISGLLSPSVDLNPSFPCLGGDMEYSILDKDPLTSSDMIYRPMQWDYGGENAALTPLVNYSASQVPLAPVKLELPSLQLPEPRFGQHSFTENVDFYGVSPQTTSDVALPCNDGLLDDIIHGPKAASSNGLKSGGLDDPISPLTGSFSSVEESSGEKKSTGTVASGMDACDDFLMDNVPTQYLEYCHADNLPTWGLGSL